MNHELPDVQAGLRKGRETRVQIVSICWSKRQEKFQKNICFCLIDYAKAFDCVDHHKLWKILQEMGIPDQTTWPASWEICMQVRKQQNWTWNNRLVPNWERSVSRLYIVTLLFNWYAEYILQNARLDEAQAGIKIAGRNISNIIYADDTTLMAESEEELKSLLMSERGEWKSWLETQHWEN